MEIEVILAMPPQSNNLYGYSKKHGKRFKIKTHPFFKAVEDTVKAHPYVIKMIQKETSKTKFLEVSRIFCFHRVSILTKKHEAKVMDVSNRLKSLDDELAKIIGVDDCRFWYSAEEKVEIPDWQNERVIIRLKPYQPRSLEEIRLPVPGISLRGVTIPRASYSAKKSKSASQKSKKITSP